MHIIFPWQKKQTDVVNQLLEQQRFPHALLLWGNEGLGKKAFTQSLIKEALLLDANLQQDEQLVHPDLSHLKADKGQITIEKVRELQSKLNLSSRSVSGTKVVIIDKAEQLNTAASNALLKILEEPTNNTYFILLSNTLGSVAKTVQSRCYCLYFQPATLQTTQDYLKQAQLPTEGAFLLNGSPLMVHKDHFQVAVKRFSSFADSWQKFLKQTISLQVLIDKTNDFDPCYLVYLLQQMIVMAVQYRYAYVDIAPFGDARLSSLFDLLDIKVLFKLYDKLNEMKQSLSGHANQILSYESFFIYSLKVSQYG